jgi:hypothetical protein
LVKGEESTVAPASPPRRLHLEMIARSTIAVARCCTLSRLGCRDPPAATSRVLEWLGYNQYQVRSFWAALAGRSSASLEVYRYHGTTFRLEALYKPGPLRSAPLAWEGFECPLDSLDAEGIPYSFAPRAHRLYLYITGGIGASEVHVNVVRLLRLMEASRPGVLGELEDLVVGLIWSKIDPAEAASRLAGVIAAWTRPLSAILPRVPDTGTLLERLVPPLRRPGGRGG